LLAQLREAEARGFNVRDDLSMLVNTQPFEHAEDVAAALTHRVARYVAAMGYPELINAQLVTGLFPRSIGITDPDVVSALCDRANAIEDHARILVAEAIDRGEAWLTEFGEAPETSEHYMRWFRDVSIGAAYLERWGIKDMSDVRDDAVSPDQEAQRDRVLAAMDRTLAVRTQSHLRKFSTCDSFESHALDFAVER
jgi:hypothetical protein